MLYLAIDLHSRQLTVNNRDEDGTALFRRQVSTKWEKVRAFFAEMRKQAEPHGGYVAIVEVCGFEDWLVKMLREYGCGHTVLVQSKERAKRKTDRIDANKLGELLWMNRFRLANGERLQHLRHIQLPSEADASARQITALRDRFTRDRTRTTNQVRRLLRKHNLSQECPTKSVRTIAAAEWLAAIPLPVIDRVEMDLLLARWKLWDKQLATIEKQLQALQKTHVIGALIATIPGLGGYSSLAIASRIGDINRFPRPGSLANFWGLTPSCRNSGETRRRLGAITKEGSTLVRFLLGQAVYNVLRACPKWRNWYRNVKARRGSKIARVAVMRRLATTIWQLVKHNEPFRPEAGFCLTPPASLPLRNAAPTARTPSPLAGPWRKGPAGPPVPFPHTPNPLPLFSVVPKKASKNHDLTRILEVIIKQRTRRAIRRTSAVRRCQAATRHAGLA